jgi:hypothetical protein
MGLEKSGQFRCGGTPERVVISAVPFQHYTGSARPTFVPSDKRSNNLSDNQ